MALLDVIRHRYSVRRYEPRAVDPARLKTVLEAARLAPSARNIQEWRFVVVQDPDTRARLVPACNNQAFVGTAPVVIAGCAVKTDYIMRCGQHAYPIDLAIAMEHMALQAVAEGLGTCWIGSFFEEQVRAVLGIPDDVRVVELMTLGTPADQQHDPQREPLEHIVCHERWTG